MADHTDNTADDTVPAAKSKTAAYKLALLIVVVVGLFAAFKFLPVNEYLAALLDYVESLGVWGPVILAVVYVVATVLMIPGSILSLGAGFTFGLVRGTIAVSAGATIGALCAFLIGRTMARGFVEQKMAEHPKFAAIDRATEAAGFKIVLLTRLSPVFPFNLLNYLFSITRVRTRDYFLGSWIGMIPGTIMYVYLGSVAENMTQLVSGNTEQGAGQYILLGVGLAATIVVTVYITRIARRALAEYVPEEKGVGSDE